MTPLLESIPRLTAQALAATESAPQPPVPFVLYFLLVSLVIAVVSSAIRIREPRRIAGEALRFFVYIVAGIALFSVVVFIIEQLFVR